MQLRLPTTALALFLPACALAQAPGRHTSDATALDRITVTATRTAVTVDQSLSAVEVIDHDQIARSQATSLPELLRGRAGINLSNQGGAGKLTTLFLRGSESDHVLVLVDGVRIGSATSGLAAFQDLPLALIDRIEIVRGPRSSLYGSDAIGGVIQVFTRHDQGASRARAALSVGSHQLREASAGIGGGDALGNGMRGWYGIDAAYQRTDGINACNVATPDWYSGGCFIQSPQPDRDGYRNRSLSVRGGINAGDAFNIQGHVMRVEGHDAYDGDFVDNSDVVQQVVGGNATWQPADSFKLQLTAGRNIDASRNFLGTAPMGRFSTDRDSATLQGDVTLAPGQLLTLGLDWLHDRVDSDTPYDAIARGNRAAFAQYQGRLGMHDLQAALRRDDNDQFGGHTTGSAAWGMGLGAHWRATASYGTAFKAPTFNELYYPFFGNSTLRPESSRTVEAGIARHGDRFHWRLDAFTTAVDDLIAYDAALHAPNNIERARLRGAELELGGSLGRWNVDASSSWLDPRSRSGAYSGNLLPRRARRTARIDIDRRFGKFSLGVTGIGEGSRFDDLANTRRLGGHGTLNLRAEYAITPAWNVQAHVSNAFDRAYETAAFYNQPRREFGVGLRWRPTD